MLFRSKALHVIAYIDVDFFFQAEDGIRDLIVTGVQTCALPICRRMSGLERVTREAGHAPAVEAKADRPRGVGQKTLGDAAGTPHQPSESPGPPTARISWLRVWRRTLRSLRQPPTCSHHSRCQPQRFSRA